MPKVRIPGDGGPFILSSRPKRRDPTWHLSYIRSVIPSTTRSVEITLLLVGVRIVIQRSGATRESQRNSADMWSSDHEIATGLWPSQSQLIRHVMYERKKDIDRVGSTRNLSGLRYETGKISRTAIGFHCCRDDKMTAILSLSKGARSARDNDPPEMTE